MRLHVLILLFVLMAAPMCSSNPVIKRYLYIMAHMVNTIQEMEFFLNRGANSFECDLNYDSYGAPESLYHGSDAEDGREGGKRTLPDVYLEHLRQLSNKSSSLYRKEFCLIYFDLKLNSVDDLNNAGRETARLLVDHYWTNETGPGYVIFSLPKTKQADFIIGVNAYLKENGLEEHRRKCGYDFSGNEKLSKIQRTYESLGLTDNIWQGDGTYDYKPRNFNRMKECNEARDCKENFIKKTYRWTIDHVVNIEKALRIGTDGIMTNKPEVARNVMTFSEFSDDVRLALPTDNPFERVRGECPQ